MSYSQLPEQQQQSKARGRASGSRGAAPRFRSLLLEQLAPDCIPVLLSHLGPPDLLALFCTCHTTKRWVLGHAGKVHLRMGCRPTSKRVHPQALEALFEVGADGPEVKSLIVSGLSKRPLPALAALHQGRVRQLCMAVSRDGCACAWAFGLGGGAGDGPRQGCGAVGWVVLNA